MADNEVSIHVSADTKSARDEFKALGSEAVGAFNAVGEQGKIAGAKLAALDKAWDSPLMLMKAATAAKVELDSLIASVEKAGKVTPAMAKNFEDAGAKIDMAAKRAKQFADTAGDLGTKGDFAARGMESLAGKVGSVNGLLGLTKDTGGKAAGAMADVGFAVMAAVAAFELAMKALDGYKKLLADASESFGNYADRQAAAATRAELFATASLAVEKGLITAGATISETAAKWQDYVVNTLHAADSTDKFAAAIAKLKVPDSLGKITEDAQKMEMALALAFSEGGKRFSEYAVANKAALDDVAARYRRLGLEVPEYVQKAIKATEEATKAEERNTKAVADAKRGQEDKLKSMSEVWTKQQEAIKQGEVLIKQYEQGTISYKEQVNGLAEIAGKYGLTVDGLIELIRANKDYKAALDEARTSIGAQSSAFDEQIERSERLLAVQLKLNAAQYAGEQKRRDGIDAMSGYTAKSKEMAEAVDSGLGYLGRQAAIQDAINAGLAEGKEGLASHTVIMMEFTKATEAQIDALDRLAKKFTEVSDTQNVLVDYAANILASVQTGLTSVDIALTQLNDTIQQLTELKMKNMGSVFEEQITRMLAAYEQLRMQLQMGQAGSTPKLRT